MLYQYTLAIVLFMPSSQASCKYGKKLYKYENVWIKMRDEKIGESAK